MILFWISFAVAGLCLWVSGQSFAVGNRRGGLLLLFIAAVNVWMAILNLPTP